ncbi:membrane protein [Xanthomonas vasicola pv. vasculorum NCPPB 1381]|nr:membrane protein [Xanthomonas vasicola pv. vasculorum NCPPB 1381]
MGVLFFLSGAAALIYQVSWQRVLFSGLGADTLSVAVIVSVFMLGLGLGALIGGWAADRATSPLRWFLAVELGIACYGVCSVAVIDLVMMHAGGLGLGHGVVVFGALFALIVPTTLMGMTLPILVILLDRVVRNVGEATGLLYLANTMGAASGAIVTGLYLFHIMDLRQVTWLAAAINATVALCGWFLARRASSVRWPGPGHQASRLVRAVAVRVGRYRRPFPVFLGDRFSSRDCGNAASGDRNRCAEECIVPGGAPFGQQ